MSLSSLTSTERDQIFDALREIDSMTKHMKEDYAFFHQMEQDLKADIVKRIKLGDQNFCSDLSIKSCTLEKIFYQRASALDLKGTEVAHAEWKNFKTQEYDELHLFRDPTIKIRMVNHNMQTRTSEDEVFGDDNMAIIHGDEMIKRNAAHESVLQFLESAIPFMSFYSGNITASLNVIKCD
jgi:hypothetical protein